MTTSPTFNRANIYTSPPAFQTSAQPATFPLVTTTNFTDGYHELDAIAYEGSHVRTQTRATQNIFIQNTPLSATLTPLLSGTNSALQPTLQITVTASANNINTIQLFSTGGLLAANHEFNSGFGDLLGEPFQPGRRPASLLRHRDRQFTAAINIAPKPKTFRFAGVGFQQRESDRRGLCLSQLTFTSAAIERGVLARHGRPQLYRFQHDQSDGRLPDPRGRHPDQFAWRMDGAEYKLHCDFPGPRNNSLRSASGRVFAP